MGTTPPERIIPAQRAKLANSAIRALDDPVALERAARIIRAALQRNKLTLADLAGPIVSETPR